MATNEVPTTSGESLATAQVRLPGFWPQNPAVWFTQVEAIFDLRHITSRYLHVVSALSSEVVGEFSNVLDAPHANPYDRMKTTGLQRKPVSVRRRL